MIHQPHSGSATKSFMTSAPNNHTVNSSFFILHSSFLPARDGSGAPADRCVLSRNANNTPSPVMIAANIAQNDEPITLRLGSFGFDGNPYTSGLSSRR